MVEEAQEPGPSPHAKLISGIIITLTLGVFIFVFVLLLRSGSNFAFFFLFPIALFSYFGALLCQASEETEAENHIGTQNGPDPENENANTTNKMYDPPNAMVVQVEEVPTASPIDSIPSAEAFVPELHSNS